MVLETDPSFSVCRGRKSTCALPGFLEKCKNILKTDPSFSVCRRRDLPVLYLDFWNTSKNILCAQEKEYLPVRALYFGDTGTPLDRKEARFNLGPLECHGDTLFTHSVTFRRQVCVVCFVYLFYSWIGSGFKNLNFDVESN
jgi:hypothetical protein